MGWEICGADPGSQGARMKFMETRLAGAFIIEIEKHVDERGFFARSWCQREFASHGLESGLVQCSISHNTSQFTLRGMHYQSAPDEEVKLVRCTCGAIYDVIIDLRRESATFRHWIAVELNAENRRTLYVPKGFAHGFLTLRPDTEIFYQMSEFYVPDSARGLRWNDPGIGIEWPKTPRVISFRDNNYPDYDLTI